MTSEQPIQNDEMQKFNVCCFLSEKERDDVFNYFINLWYGSLCVSDGEIDFPVNLYT